ncbi:MAG: prephenate dehydrogenase [Saprospiraceae bacterium]|nr:prephenate dehydrogenase [Saprospiraceae bacterium]
MTIGIIGLGLIGGSIAKDLKATGQYRLLGCDSNPDHASTAESLNIVDKLVTLDQLVEDSNLIILAFPVHSIAQHLPHILDKINSAQTVVDVGSTKAEILKHIHTHPMRARFVAAHPLAGTEFSGPTAALRHLFSGKKNIICNSVDSAPGALEMALKIFNALGMESYFMDAGEHDKHLAYVSHLSHISSFVLSLTVQDIEKDEEQIFNLAGTGFASTVRLAKSNSKTWAPIFDANLDHLIKALDHYQYRLEEFKSVLKSRKTEDTERLIIEANKIKELIKN